MRARYVGRLLSLGALLVVATAIVATVLMGERPSATAAPPNPGATAKEHLRRVFQERGIPPATLDGTPYARIYFGHECAYDLDMQIQVGNPPVCTINLFDPGDLPCDGSPGYFWPSLSDCAGYLPPTVSVPWRLEVKDVYTEYVGQVDQYYIDSGDKRYLGSNLPLAIPDDNTFVYSTIDGTQYNVCGDANSSGGATMVDAMLAAQCVVGLADCSSLASWATDVNCSGGITMVDAMLIAQKVVGLVPGLNCCG